MPEKLLQEEWAPDYGERKIHPTAGITAIGASFSLLQLKLGMHSTNFAMLISSCNIFFAGYFFR